MQAECIEQDTSITKLERYLSFQRAIAEETEGFANLISYSCWKSQEQHTSNQSTECLNNKFRCWLMGTHLLIYIGQASSKGRFIVVSVYTINKGLFDVLNVAQQTVLYGLSRDVFLHELGRWFSEVLDFMLSLGRASTLRRMDLSFCLSQATENIQADKRAQPALRRVRKMELFEWRRNGDLFTALSKEENALHLSFGSTFVRVANTGSSISRAC